MKDCCPHDKIISFFKAVCDVNRHKVLHMLKKNGEMNASDIIEKLKLSQPTVSHHLKIMIDADILTSRKEGKETFYQINEKFIGECCHGFAGNFCKHKGN